MARIPKLDSAGKFLAPDVNAQIDARTKVTMRADLPALAEELKIGGGSGSGIQVGGAAPAEGWWLDTGNRISVVPTPPTFTDVDGTASDTYTIPSQTGVEYLVAGAVKAAGTYPASGTVTVTARATSGYILAGTSSWTATFTTTVAPIGVTANVPTADDSANVVTWTPKQGVEYVIDGTVRTPPYSVGDVDATVAVTARATPGYVLSGPASWSFTFTKTPPAPIPTTTYSPAVLADSPLIYLPLDDTAGTTTPAVQGSLAAYNTFTTSSATFGAAALGAGPTSAQLPGGASSSIISTKKLTKDASGNGAFWGTTKFAAELIVDLESWTMPGEPPILASTSDTIMGLSANRAFVAKINGTWVNGLAGVTAPTGRKHLAVHWDGATASLLVNGVVQATAAVTGTWNLDWQVGIGNLSGTANGTAPKGRFAGFACWGGSTIPSIDRLKAHAAAAGLA